MGFQDFSLLNLPKILYLCGVIFIINRTKHRLFDQQSVKVVYAEALSYRKNQFLYSLDRILSGWQFELYDTGFEANRIKDSERFKYNGVVHSDQLIENVCANVGLIWDGESTSSCTGSFGEYLKINNPHKASLYIRSLEELDAVFSFISPESYNKMVENIKHIDRKISSGYYLSKALEKTQIQLRMGNFEKLRIKPSLRVQIKLSQLAMKQ
ncbi:MAG: hypothetical protein LBS79_12315 [Tannerella sp.]|nr:hypothetical protein [Tannerella sp.]